MEGIHTYPVRVQFDEVDQYGIVHHTKYFLYFERARVDLMGALGMKPGMDEEYGLIVASAEIKFRASAKFLDDLVVEQGCRKTGASRIVLAYRIVRPADSAVITTADLTLAFVDSTGRPCRAPDDIRAGLKAMGVPG
ncbi:MAG: acyl-CoA thioesterase [Proteobacteria bacterium]|nr:acyl-CoA thioesterase [Pseudomonadota bacterium]